MVKTYTFHISLPKATQCWRKIELRADQTLEQLHLAIQDAFEFDDDHLYSFFLSGKPWDQDTEYSLPQSAAQYDQLFADESAESEEPELTPEEYERRLVEVARQQGVSVQELKERIELWNQISKEVEEEELARDVRRIKLNELNLETGREFLYIFDYGDEWRFSIRVHAITAEAPDGDYPRVVQRVGRPPRQYPHMAEEDATWGRENNDGGFLIYTDDDE